jgi:hypothetical protein
MDGKSWDKIGGSMTTGESRLLKEVLKVLREPVLESLLPSSNLVDELFAQEFRIRILLQHGLQGSPLFQDTFDAAFLKAAIASGRDARNQSGETNRFWDLTLDGEKISLKSSKANDLKVGTLHISKLSEAAWIQDCRSAKARREHTLALFDDYLKTVQRIFQLRYFKNKLLYELVEIPIDLIAPILDAPVSAFAAEGSNVGIPVGAGQFDMVIVLDRSDAKITLRHIRKERCLVHGTWQLR